MRTWTRALTVTRCGGCGTLVADGAPLLEIRIEPIRLRRVRCESCEGPAPPNLPVHVASPQRFTKPMARLGTVKPSFDVRMAAVGREPRDSD